MLTNRKDRVTQERPRPVLSPLVLRLGVAGILIHHGLIHIGPAPLGLAGDPNPAGFEGGLSWLQITAIGEAGIGLLLALGLCTRLVALPLITAGSLSVAAVGCPGGTCELTRIAGEIAPGLYGGALLAVIGLSLLVTGGGRIALDAVAFGRRTDATAVTRETE